MFLNKFMGNGCTRPKKQAEMGVNNIITLQKSTSENKYNENFKVNYTDFIRKKTNMIIEDYKIKSAPLGKGDFI